MLPRPARAGCTRSRALATIAALLTPTLALAACTSSPPDRPRTAPSRSAPPTVSKYDLSGLPVPRSQFCDQLSEEGVAKALHGPVARTAHYGNGDEVQVTPGLVDVSHEFGCVYEGRDGAAARVWVFARPVARSEATTLVRRARRGHECTFSRRAGFGSPGLTSVCDLSSKGHPSGGTVRARLEGLFGDTWSGCEVSEPVASGAGGTSARTQADVLQRAVSWCTEVVTTVGARP